MGYDDLEPELGLIRQLATLVAAGRVSGRLDAYWQERGQGGLDAFIQQTYWELGFGRLEDAAEAPRVMTVGINPSEDRLVSEAGQPWGDRPLEERIRSWRLCDAWTLGEADRSTFESLNSGLAFGKQNTWAYFRRLRDLFRAAGAEDLLRASYCTNAGKFTSATVKAAGADLPRELAACRPVLDRQVRLVGPRVLVAIGREEVVPEVEALFHGAGGELALRTIPVENGKGQRRYYCSGRGRFPGLAWPVLVVGIPHTSGNAHFNFDPFLRELGGRLEEDLRAASLL